jgi:hypothetical protein
MQKGLPAWPAWNNYRFLWRHGCVTFLGMVEYHAPSVVVHYLYLRSGAIWMHYASVLLWVLATLAVPGYMTHYCKTLEPAEVFNPFRALRRVFQGGQAYWKAWGIALLAMALSFAGLLFFGLGFLLTSVWFWQVAGFSFATVFTQTFALAEPSVAKTTQRLV